MTMLFVLISLTIVSSPATSKIVYSAVSFCKVTQAVGYASYELKIGTALNKAINQCVRNGGIPSCCNVGAKITERNHAAISSCPITKVKGLAFGHTLKEAIHKAINRCINLGGVRACCNRGALY